MKGRMKINVAAVVLAVMMMCLMPFKIYAAGVPSLDEVRSAWLKGDSSIKLSDYYFIYTYTGKDRSGEFYDFTTLTVVDDSFKGQLFVYRDDNSTPVGGNIYFMSYCDEKIITGTEAGVYVRNATYYNINGSQLNSSTGLGGGYDMKYLGSDIMKNFNISDTNIPLFDSKESAENYFSTGDTSGLLNGDKVSSYDPSIEVPKDLAVNFTAANFLDTSSSNKYGRFDYADSDVIFTWNQSEDVDISNYKTEIYTQLTVQWANTPFNPFSPNWHEQLASKQLVNTVDTLRSNSYTMSKSTFKDIVQKSGDEVIDGGIMGGSVSYIKEPMYFYLRNVVGNSYSDWVRVKITRDTVTTEGIPAFGNGSGAVTSGYDQVKGDSSVGGGNGQAITGDTSGGSYGKNYSVEFDSASMSGIIGFIKNGFGLLGDDGLIVLFKETFSFLPAPVWTCIIAMIAASCIVVIWKVVH